MLKPSIGWCVAGVLAIAVLVLWLRPPSGGPAPAPNGPESELSDAAKEALGLAERLQKQEAWEEAAQAWGIVLLLIPDQPAFADVRREAEQNRRIAAERRDKSSSLVESVSIPPPPEEQRPAVVERNKVTEFYPLDRETAGVTMLDINGQGTNRNWLLQGTKYFAYRYQVPIRIKVVRNDGATVVFRQTFGDVVQLRAVSKEDLQLKPPDPEPDPLVDLIEGVLETHPVYKVVKQVWQIAQIADPGLKRTLTYFKDALVLGDDTDAEMAAKIEAWAGKEFELEYQSGLGVTKITSLDGKFPEDDLRLLARNSSLFMDYFWSEVATLPVGEKKTVSTRDVRAMLEFGYDADVVGELTLHNDGAEEQEGEALTRLTLNSGEFDVRALVGDIERSGVVRVTSGTVSYSPEDLMVRTADLTLEGNLDWVTDRSLLFGTETAGREAKVRLYYRAKRVEGEAGNRGGEGP
jgi:hypothetical protein